MKNKYLLVTSWMLMQSVFVFGQTANPYVSLFPTGTVIHNNVPYYNDADPRHLLDLYLPANANGKLPLVIFVHGGGWISNDKYADLGYMKKTVVEIVGSGVDKNDPPFLIIHGEKDDIVSNQQSKLLHAWLDLAGVPNELIIVKDAPHFGAMYDVDEIRNKVIGFLKKYLS